MAVISPYGDPNAHGSIGGSLTFRRRFGKVILQKKSDPVQPDTPAQIAQRVAFKDANYDYYSYPVQSKRYYGIRGPDLGMSAKNLYVHASLLGLLPSQVAKGYKEITQAQIITTICPGLHTGNIDMQMWDSVSLFWVSAGSIDDNENILTGNPLLPSTYTKFRMTFWTDTYDLFRYGIWLELREMGGGLVEKIVRVISPANPGVTVYISEDGSSFEDEPLVNLNGTNNF